MGPRPPRRGAQSEATRPPAPAARTKPVVVERIASRAVVKPASRHVASLDTVPLPGPVLAALASIAADLRDLPRACVGDAAELLFWLRRTAARVDGVAALRMTKPQPRPKRKPDAVASLAESVFGPPGPRCSVTTRTVTGRRGRQVAVEIRRARERGQFELPI